MLGLSSSPNWKCDCLTQTRAKIYFPISRTTEKYACCDPWMLRNTYVGRYWRERIGQIPCGCFLLLDRRDFFRGVASLHWVHLSTTARIHHVGIALEKLHRIGKYTHRNLSQDNHRDRCSRVADAIDCIGGESINN